MRAHSEPENALFNLYSYLYSAHVVHRALSRAHTHTHGTHTQIHTHTSVYPFCVLPLKRETENKPQFVQFCVCTCADTTWSPVTIFSCQSTVGLSTAHFAFGLHVTPGFRLSSGRSVLCVSVWEHFAVITRSVLQFMIWVNSGDVKYERWS